MARPRSGTWTKGIVVGIVFGGLVATGVSWASIPDSSGVIHGCYKTRGTSHELKVIDTAVTASCPAGYTPLTWDQTPPGIGVGTGAATAASGGGATCTIGQIELFAGQGSSLPTNYVAADGQVVTIASDIPLFSLIGITYGGNGTSNFALPSLQSLAPDNMTYAICVSGVFP